MLKNSHPKNSQLVLISMDVFVLQIEDKEELGEWVGLCKIDKEGKPRKVVKCSCAVVKVTIIPVFF